MQDIYYKSSDQEESLFIRTDNGIFKYSQETLSQVNEIEAGAQSLVEFYEDFARLNENEINTPLELVIDLLRQHWYTDRLETKPHKFIIERIFYIIDDCLDMRRVKEQGGNQELAPLFMRLLNQKISEYFLNILLPSEIKKLFTHTPDDSNNWRDHEIKKKYIKPDNSNIHHQINYYLTKELCDFSPISFDDTLLFLYRERNKKIDFYATLLLIADIIGLFYTTFALSPIIFTLLVAVFVLLTVFLACDFTFGFIHPRKDEIIENVITHIQEGIKDQYKTDDGRYEIAFEQKPNIRVLYLYDLNPEYTSSIYKQMCEEENQSWRAFHNDSNSFIQRRI